MGIPRVYSGGKAPVVSLDFFDVATGTGYKTLYAGDFNSSTAGTPGNYVLQSEANYSDVGSTDSGANAALDLDFDIKFTRPLTIFGDCIINVPALLFKSGAGDTVSSTVTGFLRKWDGTTETHIISGAAILTQAVSTDSLKFDMAAIRVNVPRTNIPKDTYLRLSIVTTAPGASKSVIIGHDGAGRVTVPSKSQSIGGTDWTQAPILKVNIPVVLDI